MSSLIKGVEPLVGAAAVRGPAVDPPIYDPVARESHNASVREHRRCRVVHCPICKTPPDVASGVAAAVPTGPGREWTKDAHGVVGAGLTADVENDGDRGPRAARDPLSVLDQAADAARAKVVQRLMAAVAGLSVDEVRALSWIARELPGAKLRRRCEEATATGWCATSGPAPVARSTELDRARAAVLGAWRQVVALVHGARSSASEDLRQRPREDVLADEAARRAGGAK